MNLIQSANWERRLLSKCSIKSVLLVFPVVFFCTAFFHREAFHTIPTLDHKYYQSERLYVSSDRAQLAQGFSHDRTARVNPGNFFLFRPLTTLTTTASDILFHANPALLGLTILILHSSVVTAAFFLLLNFLPVSVATTATALLLIQGGGQEMIRQLHVSPYSWALFFWALGVGAFYKQKRLAAVCCFFLATLSNEIIPVSLLLVGTLVFVWVPQGQKKARWILFPAALYFFLSWIDYGLRVLPPAFAIPQKAGVFNILEATVGFAGHSVLSLFSPLSYRFKADMATGYLNPLWVLPSPNLLWIYCLGLALLGIVTIQIVRFAKNGAWVGLFSGFGLVSTVVLVAAGRLAPNGGTLFLSENNYYFYFSHFFLVIFLFSSQLIRFNRFMVIFLFFLTISHTLALEKRSSVTKLSQEKIAQSIVLLKNRLAPLNNHCYTGDFSFLVDPTVIPIPLSSFWRESCALKAGVPIYAVQPSSGELQLFPFPNPNLTDLSPELFKSPIVPGKVFTTDTATHFRFADSLLGDPGIRLSGQSWDASHIQFTLTDPFRSVVIFGYKNEQNYQVLLFLGPHKIVLLQKKAGKTNSLGGDPTFGIRLPLNLQIVAIGEKVYLMRENTLYGVIPGLRPKDLRGKVGLATSRRIEQASDFGNIGVSEQSFVLPTYGFAKLSTKKY